MGALDEEVKENEEKWTSLEELIKEQVHKHNGIGVKTILEITAKAIMEEEEFVLAKFDEEPTAWDTAKEMKGVRERISLIADNLWP